MNNTFYSDFDTETREPRNPGDYRTAFQIDRDRVIHTSAFRRLQNKTQVFLAGQYDFYRTRLTHSIEVAQIGRSICAFLRASGGELTSDRFIDPDLVEASCLAHDIGHPPFGHAGERTLNRLMSEFGGFEGNAQTLRLLTETIFSGRRDGMNPTRAFADSVLKYKTLRSELGTCPENHFLYDEQHRVLDFVFAGRGSPTPYLPGPERDALRSIECQIMDWADDTAYSVNDISDGIRAGFLDLRSLEGWAADQRDLTAEESQHVHSLCRTIREDRVESRLARKIGAFITACRLVPDANFLSDTTERYRYRLEIDPSRRTEASLYKRIALDLVFRSQRLCQLDYKGDLLLTRLFTALHDRYIADSPTSRFRLLPESAEREIAAAGSRPARARLVCDAVAAMTDAFAMRTYRRLFDPGFGSIVDLV